MAQKVLLRTITDNIMQWAKDPDSYMYGVMRSTVMLYVNRSFQELNFAGLKSVKLYEAEITVSGKVQVPDDFIEYVRVYYCVGNYLMPAFSNKNINTLQYESLKDVEEKLIETISGKKIITPSGKELTALVKTNEHVPATGHPQGWCFLEGYKYDHINGYFVFDYVPDGVTHVAVEYVADPLLQESDPGELGVHKFFEKAIERWVYWRIIETRRNVPINEKIRAKKEWLINYQDACKQMNSKPQELIQAIMGWKHMCKTGYAGMGAQVIPSPKPLPVVHSALYDGYVCQSTPAKDEKTNNHISASSISDKQYVSLMLTAEKEVHTNVVVVYEVLSYARTERQSATILIEKGKKNVFLNVPPEFYGKTVKLAILSVDGIANSTEDARYVYTIDASVALKNPVVKPINHISALAEVDPLQVEGKRIKITYTAEYNVASNVQIECSTKRLPPEPNYSTIDHIYKPNIKTSFLVYDQFLGEKCALNIVSVDGKAGAFEDAKYIYEIQPMLAIDNIVVENVIIPSVEWRMTDSEYKLFFRVDAQYPVFSNVHVRYYYGAGTDAWGEIKIFPNNITNDIYINMDIDSIRLIEITGTGEPKDPGVTEDSKYRYVLSTDHLNVPPNPSVVSLQSFIPSGNEAVGTVVNLVDERDSQVYRCIKMADGRWWMGENLKYAIAGSVYYNNDASNLATYGRLYSASEALDASPERWGVPSDEEWKVLETALGMPSGELDNSGMWRGSAQNVGTQLKQGGSSGLDLLMGGFQDNNGNYNWLAESGYYWTSTKFGIGTLIRGVSGNDGIYRDKISVLQRNSARLILNV